MRYAVLLCALLEEDDRVKEPVIRFPRVDSGLQGWYDMKRRLNEASGVKFGFDYNSLYQSANNVLTGDDSAWSGVLRIPWYLGNVQQRRGLRWNPGIRPRDPA
jgi:hypothetical protein